MQDAMPAGDRNPVESPWRPVLHRWFVEYNPAYLLSAAFVLAGTMLLSRGLAAHESLLGGLGVTAVAELYAAALIGSAALLMRIGQRRSAVMLALLAVFYQGDVTLHTDTSPAFGWAGPLAAGAWLALFGAKLSALARAMQLRLSRPFVATMALGALGLAAFPYLLPSLPSRAAAALIMLWLLALSSIPRAGSVTSSKPLDAWGNTVARRAVKVTWAVLALLLWLHITFWSTQGHFDLIAVAPVLPLVLTRWLRTDARTWATLAATLLFVAWASPPSFSAAALAAAAALLLRARDAWHTVTTRKHMMTTPAGGAYRAGDDEPRFLEEAPDRAGAARPWLVGAAVASYLALWTLGWSGGPWPAHIFPLDLLATAAALLGAWRARARAALAPAAAAWAHLAWQARLVSAPDTLAGWGGASIAIGFVMLLASLATSYALRPRLQPGGAPARP
jgi:hypothetical protein